MTFVEIPADSNFTYYNLPYGIFSRKGEIKKRIGVAIGNHILDLSEIAHLEEFSSDNLFPWFCALHEPSLNKLMSLGSEVWAKLRKAIIRLLSKDNETLQNNAKLKTLALYPIGCATMHLPAKIGDFTDFYSKKELETKANIRLSKPVGYHGHSNSIVVSGTDILRPKGDIKAHNGKRSRYGSTKKLDFDLKLGFFTGPGNKEGKPIDLDEAIDHIFGVVLVNVWSARDFQILQNIPFGCYPGKNFGITISPWVVTMEALDATIPQKDENESFSELKYEVDFEVLIKPENLAEPVSVVKSNIKHLDWSLKEYLVQHIRNGCKISPGDLLVSGTISNPISDHFGSMFELYKENPEASVPALNREKSYLQDQDVVIIRGCASKDKVITIGFGDCIGRILPA